MSIKNDAFYALSCLRYEVDQRIVEDVTVKVTAMFNMMQNEIDELRAQSISETVRAHNLQGVVNEHAADWEDVSTKGEIIIEAVETALAAAKTAIDDFVAVTYPEESGYLAVMAAHGRTKNVGTIAYAAEVLQLIRAAQDTLKV